jgi:hypothetical protein
MDLNDDVVVVLFCHAVDDCSGHRSLLIRPRRLLMPRMKLFSSGLSLLLWVEG